MRALLRTDRSDDDLARALAKVGLYVERLARDDDAVARLRQVENDVVVVDPRLLDRAGLEAGRADSRGAPAPRRDGPEEQSLPLEELCYRRLETVLDKLRGGTLPDLYATVMAQSERALLRLALERSSCNSDAAQMLGIHRNTFARRINALGLSRRDAAAPASRDASDEAAPSHD